MSRKIFSTGLIAIILAAIAIVYVFATMMRPISFKTIDISHLHLDVATTNAERQLGLGGRQTMADDEGMLFIFDKPGIHPFWMKGMNFPIDIIWLNGDRVVEVATLQPPVGNEIPATHVPVHLADKVLEINDGLAKKLGIVAGVHLLLPQD